MNRKTYFARVLRQNQTEVEKILWFHLKSRKLNGIKFKRQEVVGNYIVDFLSFEKMIVIELDGGQHNNPKNIVKDRMRTQYLESIGFTVLRFWDNEVYNNIEGVLTVILENVSTSP